MAGGMKKPDGLTNRRTVRAAGQWDGMMKGDGLQKANGCGNVLRICTVDTGTR